MTRGDALALIGGAALVALAAIARGYEVLIRIRRNSRRSTETKEGRNDE